MHVEAYRWQFKLVGSLSTEVILSIEVNNCVYVLGKYEVFINIKNNKELATICESKIITYVIFRLAYVWFCAHIPYLTSSLGQHWSRARLL